MENTKPILFVDFGKMNAERVERVLNDHGWGPTKEQAVLFSRFVHIDDTVSDEELYASLEPFFVLDKDALEAQQRAD